MKRILFVCSVFALFYFTSCNTAKRFHSNVQPQEIKDLQHFEHFAYLFFIDKGNQLVPNDSLSQVSKEVFRQALTKVDGIPISDEIHLSDSSLLKRVQEEINYLRVNVTQKGTVSGVALPPTLDSLLEIRGKRFGLITYTTGFLRKKGNYGKQLGKGFLIGLATLGTYVPVATKSSSAVTALIIDSEEDNVAYFRNSIVDEGDPLNPNLLTEQIRRLFKKYFWKK